MKSSVTVVDHISLQLQEVEGLIDEELILLHIGDESLYHPRKHLDFPAKRFACADQLVLWKSAMPG